MREGPGGDFLDDEAGAGAIRRDLHQYLRGANAAGFNTADSAVQVALINAWAATNYLTLGHDMMAVIGKVADELRMLRRGTGGSYS